MGRNFLSALGIVFGFCIAQANASQIAKDETPSPTQAPTPAADAAPNADKEPLAALLHEMQRLGFQLDFGPGGAQLVVPSGAIWTVPPEITAEIAAAKNADVKYRRAGDQVAIEIGSPSGKKIRVDFNTESLAFKVTQLQDSTPVKVLSEEAPDPTLIAAIRDLRKGAKEVEAKNGLDAKPAPDLVFSNYDPTTHMLSVSESSSGKLLRSMKIFVPQGVKINIIDGKMLLLKAQNDIPFLRGNALTGVEEGSTAVLGLSPLLASISRRMRIETTCTVPSGATPGESPALAALDSIQLTMNEFLETYIGQEIDREVKKGIREKEAKSADGYVRLRAASPDGKNADQAGSAPVLFNPSAEPPSVRVLPQGIRKVRDIRALAENRYEITTQLEPGVTATWEMKLDPAFRTYSVENYRRNP